MYQFTHKRPDEKVIRILRRHKIIFWKAIFSILFIFLAVGILFCFVVFDFWSIVLILFISLLASGGIFAYWWYLWFNDLYILTDQRLIDIDQNDLFSRRVNEMPLDRIQDVTYEVIGLLPTLFHFGKVIIKTAGPEKDIVIETIPNPQQVAEEISNVFRSYRQKKEPAQSEEKSQLSQDQSSAI